MALILIVAIIVSIFVFSIKNIRKPANYPPGPKWLPFIGNLPELRKLSRELGGEHFALAELAKKFNTNVLGLKLGSEYVVVVFSYPVVRKVFTVHEYNGRPDSFFLRLRTMGTRKGITCTDGEHWKIHRTFIVSHLRNLDFGNKIMEHKIKDEISEILPILQANSHKTQIRMIMAPAVINIFWAIACGSRFNYNDARLTQLLEILDIRSKAFDISGGTLSLYPWLRFIAPERTGYNLIKRLNQKLRILFMETIIKHHQTWTEGQDDDLIYAYITEMKKANGHNTTFTEDQLIMVCLDLFIGGSQTTSSTLDFAFLMMILYPDIQNKVHKCLDDTFDKSEEISYSDRHRVPYVEAILLEVERYSSVGPIAGPRRVLQDTVLEGYFIPQDTTVLISLHSVHNDKEYWKDPEVFRPERFLDDNGKLLSHERLIPFGLGKRRCLGEVFARSCIFLFFVTVMKKYDISILPGTEKPSGKCLPGLVLTPENYRAQFTLRCQ